MPHQIGMPPATAGKTGGKVYPGKFNIGEDASTLGITEYQEGTTYGVNPDTEIDKLTVTTDKQQGHTP